MFTFYLNSNTHNFFSFHGGYFAKHHNLAVPGNGFSVAGLERAKFGFYRFRSFLLIVAIVVRYRFYLKLHFDKLQSKVSQW